MFCMSCLMEIDGDAYYWGNLTIPLCKDCYDIVRNSHKKMSEEYC